MAELERYNATITDLVPHWRRVYLCDDADAAIAERDRRIAELEAEIHKQVEAEREAWQEELLKQGVRSGVISRRLQTYLDAAINAWRRAKAERDERAERAEADVAALQRMDAQRFRVLGRWRRIATAAIRAWRKAKTERDELEGARHTRFEIAERCWGSAVAKALFPEERLRNLRKEPGE